MNKTEMLKIFQDHIDAELRQDVDATMATMTDNPHLNHVPTMVSAAGEQNVRAFYTKNLPGKFFPPDTEMLPISRTIGEDQIVDEIIFKCTHTTPIAWLLPDIVPTGKRIEIPLVVIFNFANNKIAHEHIYWDQASVLIQVGLLDPKGLPIYGIATAEKMLELNV